MSQMSDQFEVSPRRQAFDRAMQRAVARLQMQAVWHWLFVLNLTSALFVGLAFLAPLLSAAGLHEVGQALFQSYHLACHQYPERSFFVAGYQVAFCQRDVAIFGSISLAGVGYSFRRGRVKPPAIWLYALLVAPMAVDGFTQLLEWRESTPELRVVTGVLFGVATVWLLYPYIERTMVDLWDESMALLARSNQVERPGQGGD